jgi:hypothetical protein
MADQSRPQLNIGLVAQLMELGQVMRRRVAQAKRATHLHRRSRTYRIWKADYYPPAGLHAQLRSPTESG